MSSKKGMSSNTGGTSFDRNMFVSKDAEERYAITSQVNFIKERGTDFTNPNPTKYRAHEVAVYSNTVVNRKWEMLIADPPKYYPVMVQEFYANLKEARGDSCYVRGKWVNFSTTKINEIYQLEAIEQDDYTTFIL